MAALRPLPGSFDEHVAHLDDPRVERTKRYALLELLFFAFCAVLAGCRGWDEIAHFARTKRRWFEQWFDLPDGTPCADTFGRLFARLAPPAFAGAFGAWIQQLRVRLPGEVIALDGKAVRGAFDTAARTTPLHVLHAWATEQQLLLGHRAVAGAPGEIAGIEELLRRLEVEGCVLTADANGCTQGVAEAIVGARADYALALKGNRGPVHDAVVAAFASPADGERSHREVDAGHGRVEARTTRVRDAAALPAALRERWAGLRALVAVERQRTVGEATSAETAYYLSSLPPEPARLARVVRAHWSVENQLHWVLDVTMGEDECRVRDKTAADNLGTLRRVALGLLKHPDAGRGSVVMKQRQAGWSEAYLMQLLCVGQGEAEKPAKLDALALSSAERVYFPPWGAGGGRPRRALAACGAFSERGAPSLCRLGCRARRRARGVERAESGHGRRGKGNVVAGRDALLRAAARGRGAAPAGRRRGAWGVGATRSARAIAKDYEDVGGVEAKRAAALARANGYVDVRRGAGRSRGLSRGGRRCPAAGCAATAPGRRTPRRRPRSAAPRRRLARRGPGRRGRLAGRWRRPRGR